MLSLNEPDDEVHVARGQRQLYVFESIEQIRELLGSASRNGLARHEAVPGHFAGDESTKAAL
ncbi:hypothetical protein D3C85_1312180 [compost metagenome]